MLSVVQKKYPIPTCEVGLIAGSYDGKKGFNKFINADNDGVLIPQNTKMGIEKDVVFVKSWLLACCLIQK